MASDRALWAILCTPMHVAALSAPRLVPRLHRCPILNFFLGRYYTKALSRRLKFSPSFFIANDLIVSAISSILSMKNDTKIDTALLGIISQKILVSVKN